MRVCNPLGMSVWLFDSKAFGHRREGGPKDEGLPESSSLGALGAPSPGGMAFFLSGPLVPRVENGAHKASCPFSLKCSLQWLNWWEKRGLREVEKEARRREVLCPEGSGGRYKNEGGAPHKGQTRCNGNLVTHTPPHLLHVGPTGRDRGATYT